MPLVSFRYRFAVTLPARPDAAFRWATDYRPDDPARMGEDGRRSVRWLTPDTVVLTDTIREGRRAVSRTRLVRLRPTEHAWSSTHLGGPNRHSQFLYAIRPAGRGRSRLTFTGLHVETGRAVPAALARRARETRNIDRATWRRLARAMGQDLAPAARRRAAARRSGRGPGRRRGSR